MITPEKLQEYRDYAEFAGSDISIYSIEYKLSVMVWNLCDEVERFSAVQEYANYFCTAWHAHLAGDVAPMTFDEWCAEASRLEAEMAAAKDAAAARIKRIDELYASYSLGGCYDVDKWPEYAQSEYERLDKAQREYEARYC